MSSFASPFSSSTHEDEGFSIEEHVLDVELIDRIKSEALIRHGYHAEDEDGFIRANQKQLQLAALEFMQDKHVATSKSNLQTKSVTQFEFYQELFPNGPGAQALPESEEEKRAQQDLTKLVWGYSNVGISGFVQKSVASSGLIVCEAKVGRTIVNEVNGKKQPTTELARFLTNDGELIMLYYTGPAGAAFLRAARKLDAQLGLVSDRRPELTMAVAKQLGTVVRQAVASVPHADPKAAAALTPGSSAESDQD